MKCVFLSQALTTASILSGLLSVAACTEPAISGTTANPESSQMSSFTLAGHIYQVENGIQLKLPKALREISGLALDGDAQLYGHNDEQGIVYQIDYRAGRVLKRFGLEGALKADFEGIAWLEDRLYMTTSSGKLYEFPVGRADAMVPFAIHTRGLDCEVEGLTADRGSLLAACKNRPDGKKALHFHRWQPGAEQWSTEPVIKIKRSAFDTLFENMGFPRPEKFQPTAITATPDGTLLFIAGLQKLLLEVSVQGTPLAGARLDANMHRQPEGIAMTNDGTLIIADEGDNKGSNKSRGRLTIYRPEPKAGANL